MQDYRMKDVFVNIKVVLQHCSDVLMIVVINISELMLFSFID